MVLVGFLPVLVLVAGSFCSSAAQPNRRCNVPADVVFLMDASDSIKGAEWEQEKDFVAALIDTLEVARYAIHVGVIVYSTDIGQVIDLQPFKTKAQLQSLLQKAVQINQGTDTAKALSKLIEMSYNQGRVDAKQIAVVITDGRSTNVSATIREARRARNDYNIDMIALGVGNETFRKELEEISGSGPGNYDRLFEVQTFNQMLGVQAELEEIICEIIPTTTSTTPPTTPTTATTPSTTSPYMPPFPCSKPADVVFLIDGSYSITAEDWVKGKQFVSYLINGLDIGANSINVGIVVYSSGVGDRVDLQPFRGKTELRQAASGLIQPPVGRTNTALGLQTVRDMIRLQARPGVPHIAIVITDGKSMNPSETRDQAITAKQEGIVIFVVGVGNRVLRQEVEDMASSPETLFDAPDFRFLVGMVELLRDNICTAIGVSTTPAPSSTTSTLPPIPDVCKECLVEGGVGFNPMPDDCERYVMCIPLGLTYDPQFKTCPFGMFWSRDAVSCLDARYVTCPYDKCRTMQEGMTFGATDGGCRGYWRCAGSKSTAMCCQPGFRYRDGLGCRADSSCRDPCPLNVTIHNQGACNFRPDPDTFYGYLEVIPGQGHAKRSCQPGQVYDDVGCACTFDAGRVIPSLACTPTVNLTIDANFQTSDQQPMEVHQVSLTGRGSIYFDGTGYLSWPGLANKEIGDMFMIRLKYRMRNDLNNDGKAWNDHWQWGFERWFKNSSSHGNTHRVVVSNATVRTPDTGLGEKTLEIISISKDGSVARDPRYDVTVDATWPSGVQRKVESVQLGQIAKITTPTFDNGIVYIPNGRNSILIQEPMHKSSGATGSTSQRWRVVTVSSDGYTGRVVESGQGTVPRNIEEKYKFSMQPSLRERWFIVEPRGVVLQEGSGTIPREVRDRYAGFMAGTLIKLFMRGGGKVERWQMSRPDGSQVSQGVGELPASVKSKYDLSSYLVPGRVSKTWSVVSNDGRVLESGQGTIPMTIMAKYRNMESVTIFSSTKGGSAMDSFWQMVRPSGVKVLEGRGALPAGILRTIKGRLFSTQSTVKKWTVTMPDGTVQEGIGDIPQYILDLFASMGAKLPGMNTMGGMQGRTETRNSSVQLTADKLSKVARMEKAWTLVFPNGTRKSGTGQVPASLLALVKLQNVMGRNATRGPNPRQFVLTKDWSVTLPNGTVLTGQGDAPTYVNALVKSQGQGSRKEVISTQQEWSVTMPDGSVRKGRGSIPPEITGLMSRRGTAVQKRWTVTLPDGTVQSGTGDIPVKFQKLMGTARSKRAAQGSQHRIMDLLADCGQSQAFPPSMHLYTSGHAVSFLLKTVTQPSGTVVSLPVHEGVNDVTFIYDGTHLTGIANGITRKMPLTGPIKKSIAPVTMGKCHFRTPNTFHGEIDSFEMYQCLP